MLRIKAVLIGVFLICVVSCGQEPVVLDASTMESWAVSLEEMQAKISEDERERLGDAMALITIYGTMDREQDFVGKDIMNFLDGKTYHEIVSIADTIEARMNQREMEMD